jgi:iron complex transport system ATP-binding protein
MTRGTVLRASGVGVWRVDRRGRRAPILDGVNLTVASGEHWAVLGPNGAGKSTLLAMLAADGHPTTGTVEVLGRRLGSVDKRELRSLLGSVPDRLAERFDRRATVAEVVRTGTEGVVVLRPERLTDADHERAERLIADLGLERLAGRTFATCSRGERQRALIARALMPAPRLLVLDEAAAGLDLPGRETMIRALEGLARSAPDLASVSVSHHLEELPATTSHALLLAEGRVVAAGPVADALSAEAMTACFGIPVRVERRDGRFAAWTRP